MSYRSRPARRLASQSVRQSVIVSVIEPLEARCHLSATIKHTHTITHGHGKVIRPNTDAKPTHAPKTKSAKGTAQTTDLSVVPADATTDDTGSSTPYGLLPSQVRNAYGVNNISFNGTTGNGSGQTIAIIDAFGDTGFVNSTSSSFANSDLAKFDAATGLPDPPSFKIINETGGTTLPANPPAQGSSSANAGAAAETALDVEWAHAMAPAASIVLVQCNSLSFSDLVQNGVNTARNLPGVSVISMSFGLAGGYSGETSLDSYFTTPAGHTGITFLASTGDTGTPGGYPAESDNVVAVGGTGFAANASYVSNGQTVTYFDPTQFTGYTSEYGWSGSGGGISKYESKPSYQSTVTQSSTYRTTPDVSMLADPNTGVALYDSIDNTPTSGDSTTGSWLYGYEGGTSLAAPLWAGLVAIADQGRALTGLGALAGNTQTLPKLYQLPSSVYHDITTGSNGYSATTGYDLVTGRGTPIANTLIPDLAGGNDSGTVFVDKNGNAVDDGTDTALSGVTVYVDVNNDGVFDTGDLSTTSSSTGAFSFSDVVGGLPIREVIPAGYVSTNLTLATTGYGAISGLALGNFPTSFTAPSTTTNTITLKLDSTGTKEQIFINSDPTGTPDYTVAKSLLSSLSFTGNTGNDLLNVDLSNGSPLLSGGISFNGLGQLSGGYDRVTVIANAAGTTATYATGAITIGGQSITYSNVEQLGFTGGVGNDNLAVSTGGTPTLLFGGGGGTDNLTINGGTYAPVVDLNTGGSAVNLIANSAALTFATSQHLSSLTLNGAATATMTGTGTVLRLSGLSIATANGAALDLGTDGLVYDYSTTSPSVAVDALLASGYAAGAWNGVGIRSSAAAADSTKKHALGYGEASAALGLTGSATGTFLGETVDATTLLVRYTLYGDADLDGSVSILDFNALASHFGQPSGATWTQGDFDYDGGVSILDFNLLATNFGQTA